MSKDDAINIMKNSDLTLKNSLYIKMGEITYCKRRRETLSNRAKDYYENNKELLRESKK